MTGCGVLTFTDKGIYCPAGDFYIDPWRPVPRALITHAHADHARWGHGQYLATPRSLAVMRHRLGQITAQTADYGHVLRINDAEVSFHPAGHVPGSAQIRVSVARQVWVASGDYKTENDGLSEAFEPLRCHSFITESTFGLPVFRWQPQPQIAQQILRWWADNAAVGKTSVLGAYALGKAQRLLHMLADGPGPVLCHAAVENTNACLRAAGVALPHSDVLTQECSAKTHPGALIIAPPGAIEASWTRRFGPTELALASGWMGLRGIRRRRAMATGFVVSDHADWTGLLQATKETGAENIYVNHGYTDIFTRYLNENGHSAQVVPTEFGTEDDDSAGPT